MNSGMRMDSVVRMIRRGSGRRRRALLVVAAPLAGALEAVSPIPGKLIPPAAASSPTPVASGSTSSIAGNVAVSSNGSWHAVLINRGATGQHFVVSSDGSSWTTVPPRR